MRERDAMFDHELVPSKASFCEPDCNLCPDIFGQRCETNWVFYDFPTGLDMVNGLKEMIVPEQRARVEYYIRE